MRIGIDMRMAGTGEGIGRYIAEVAKGLTTIDKKNQYVLVFADSKTAENFTSQLPRGRVADFESEVVASKYYSWAEQTKFIKELRTLKLDLVHFPNFNVPIFYPGKFVITVHDIIHHYYPGKKKSRFFHRQAYKATIWTAVKRASRIIAVSEATKGDLIREFNIPDERVEVIYEGISASFFEHHDNMNDIQILQKYSITKPYILTVGVWRQYKNLPNLARAFDILREKYGRDYQLVLAGKIDAFYPEIEAEVHKIKNHAEIRSPGFVAEGDLPVLYRNAKVFVLPSLIEGFGLTAVEAQAARTPVCASDIPVLREILGTGAVYFDPKNPSDMADKMNLVLLNQSKIARLVDAGEKNAGKYSWSTAAEQTLEVYNRVI